jgi:hypothetical protein
MSSPRAKKFISCLSVYALFACALAAQSSTVRLVLEASEQADFWKNIQGFKPSPLERQGDTATFQIVPPAHIDTFLLRLLPHFHQGSFLLASIDSVATPDSNARVLRLGPSMRWVSLRAGAGFGKENWLDAAGFRVKNFTDKPLRYNSVLKLEQSILEQAENNGYPFAAVWLDSVRVQEDGQVSAVLQMDRNRFFEFRTFRIKGDVKLPGSYLPNYLGIKTGMPYSRARVLRLREQLRSLVFLEPTANPIVTFSGNSKLPAKASDPPGAGVGEATIHLFLQKKRASRFDFLIGLLPQPNATDGKLLLTGSLSAAFQNALNLGERFSAELERLRPETQKVDIQAGLPYILGTSFGAEARLGIFRRDSTWTDAQSELGVSYLFTGTNFVRFFWENKSSSLQKVDTLAVLSSRQLPSILDFRQNGFGLETALSRLDYRFNPRKGWLVTLKAVAGFNTVRRNSQIENLRDAADPAYSFASLYDTVSERSARYRTEIRGEIFLPFFLRSTIKIGLRGGGIFSEKPVLANENYRLGGNKLLRGFDEESLFATRFVVGTAEWRLLTGQNSFLLVFADWAYLENLAANTRVFLRPLGLGAGLNFETRAGIFGISAAVGRRDVGQSVNFRATKFHLGYVSLF